MKFVKRKIFSLIFAGVVTAVSDEILILSSNIVAGHILGDNGLSAMQLIMPIYNFVIFAAFLIGFGNAICMLLEAGKGNRENINNYFSNGIYTSLTLGVLMTGILIFIRTPFLNSLGVDGEIYNLASNYYSGIMFLPLIITVNYFLYECICNECSEKLCIVCVLVQIGLNILLSMLFGSIWGIFGVAIATVLSFIIGTLILMLGFLSKSCELKLKRFYSFKYFIRSLKLSFFNASVFLFEALYIYVINWFILSYFNESYLSIFLIITNIINIVVALCDGVLMGMKPLVGIYYSENNPLAIKRVVKICLKILIVLAVSFSIFILIFARPLTLLIGVEDPSIITESVFAIRIYCLSILFSGLSSLYSSYLLFTGHPWYSILFSTIEFGVCQILTPILFSLIFGTNGLWVGLLFAPIISLIINVSIVLIKNRTISPLLLDKKRIAHSKIFDCDACAVSVMEMADKAEQFALSENFSKTEALKARLLVEEIGMSIFYNNTSKVQIECSIIAEDSLRLIFRDNGNAQNLTDSDRPLKNDNDYFLTSIIGIYTNKNFVRATNFNRCMFCVERAK